MPIGDGKESNEVKMTGLATFGSSTEGMKRGDAGSSALEEVSMEEDRKACVVIMV